MKFEDHNIYYKGYRSFVTYSFNDNCYYGKVEDVQDLVSFEADDEASLMSAFREAVDDYIVTCKELGKIPQTRVVDLDKYFGDAKDLLGRIKRGKKKPDAIVCLKRSGFLLGAYLSNQLGLPLFTSQEIKKIPQKYQAILVVDDKVSTGATIRKALSKIRINHNPDVLLAACLYVVSGRNLDCIDYQVENLGISHDMFYELR